MDETNNKQSDVDNLQHKQDILRAMDIIPGRPKEPSEKTKTHEKNHISSGNTSGGQQTGDIPKFDLAEEIMAEHRKISATKRKAPSQKIQALRQTRGGEQSRTASNQKPELESIIYHPTLLPQEMFEQRKIIAEIVARDIGKLCESNS